MKTSAIFRSNPNKGNKHKNEKKNVFYIEYWKSPSTVGQNAQKGPTRLKKIIFDKNVFKSMKTPNQLYLSFHVRVSQGQSGSAMVSQGQVQVHSGIISIASKFRRSLAVDFLFFIFYR